MAGRPKWSGGLDGLHVDGLHVSFQRFCRPADDNIHDVPTSLGALPVVLVESDRALLPLAGNEAVWIGLSPEVTDHAVQVYIAAVCREHGREGAIVKLFNGSISHLSTLAGLPEVEGGYRVIARPLPNRSGPIVVALLVSNRTRPTARELMRVELVDYTTYARRTGLPPPAPLDPSAGYGGWLLP